MWNAYESVQDKIEIEDEISDHVQERDQFERQYYAVQALLETHINSLKEPSRPVTASRMSESPNSFRDTFKTLIHDNEALPSVQKFHLLKNSLRGEIASVIASLNASEENYFVAWDLLEQRCNKPRQIVQAHLRLLFDIPEITRDTPTNLRVLANQVQVHVTALKVLKQPIEHWEAVLVYLTVQKLDKTTRRAWERTLENETMPKFVDLINFINKQARGEEIEANQLGSSNINQDTRGQIRPVRRPQNYIATSKKLACAVCREQHEVYACPRFLQMAVRERSEVARNAKLCTNCLRVGHNAYACMWKGCPKYSRKHNSLLHFPNSVTQINSARPTENEPSTSTNFETTKAALTVTCDSEVLLGTAQIKILDKFNREHKCRVLLDGGSQTHFITERLADLLQLEKRKIDLTFSRS
ncbi:uncharacterized protein LOC122400583 [Colletes gigas]|uniref:uncharacterized protein LOC122400583 n=1 Tax=Colletes gigas TaxID=935657 RepID=UPI001C9AE94C|nr:uncharacterized protein LOC122400583 [Colletes gigas]